MKPVEIIGGGFSGLATAFYLTRRGIPVEIFERSGRLGGLVSTRKTPYGLVETAAHGILNSARVEDLFREVGADMVFPRRESRARYIYRGGPRRWPLGAAESFGLLARATGQVLFHGVRFRPAPGESVSGWGARVFGPAATELMLAPALQGIYAGSASRLSASLIFGKRSSSHINGKPRRRGLVAPRGGMGELVEKIAAHLQKRGVAIRVNAAASVAEETRWRVLCTSARDASRLLHSIASETSRRLSRVEMLPLVTTTSFYCAGETGLSGFGILFPRQQGFRVLGVLFDTNIFEGRGEGHSETWILGGAEDPSVTELGDAVLFDLIDGERERLFGRRASPLCRYVTRWDPALPHYTVELESLLAEPLPLPSRTFLVGNYLGAIGLAKILDRAHDTAAQIAGEYRRVA